MSHQMVARVLAHSQATGPAFSLLMTLAHDEYGKGQVLRQDTLAEAARISRATAQRALIELQVIDELVVTSRGKKRPNHHLVALECPAECPDHLKHCYVPKHQSDASEGIGCIREEHSMHQSDARSSSKFGSLRNQRAGQQKLPSQPDEEALRRAAAERLTEQFGQHGSIQRVFGCGLSVLAEVEDEIRAELIAEVARGIAS